MSEAVPQAKITEHPERDESTGFDYRVHIKNAKTGQLIRIQNYARHSFGSTVLLERPQGSGNCFTENGEPCGRFRFFTEDKEAKYAKIGEDHIETKAPPVNHMDALTQENDALRAELDAIKAATVKQQERTAEKPQQAAAAKVQGR